MGPLRIRGVDVRDALRRVERELGPGALIVRTDPVPGGVEIVAVGRAPAVVPPARPEDAPGRAFGLPPAWRARFRAGNDRRAAARALADAIPTVRLEPPAWPVLAVVGTTGVGKSTTVAKLAARRRLGGEPVTIVTTDVDRPGSTALLEAVAAKIGARLIAARGLRAIATAVERHRGDGSVVIDTAGVAPRERTAVRDLGSALAAADAATVLCVPAATRAADAAPWCAAWRDAGARAAAITKWDETDAPGEPLCTAVEAGFPIAWITVGRRIPGDLVDADALAIAARAIGLDDREAHELLASPEPC